MLILSLWVGQFSEALQFFYYGNLSNYVVCDLLFILHGIKLLQKWPFGDTRRIGLMGMLGYYDLILVVVIHLVIDVVVKLLPVTT